MTRSNLQTVHDVSKKVKLNDRVKECIEYQKKWGHDGYIGSYKIAFHKGHQRSLKTKGGGV